MLSSMRRPNPALSALIVFWTLYAIAVGWKLSDAFDAIEPVSRDLLLILGGYGAILAVITGAILLRIRFTRPHDVHSH
jgi:hypothetical protein